MSVISLSAAAVRRTTDLTSDRRADEPLQKRELYGQATAVKTIAPALSIENNRQVAPSGDFDIGNCVKNSIV
ncbi:MAG: hypothetical protein H0X49_03760 [Acidobacteria bacterium]|nr:hypothetical protein [Acidobacteriota bacterium]